MLYSLWIVLGQTMAMANGRIGAGGVAFAAAYAVTAFVGFYVIPAFLSQEGRLNQVLKALLYIGTIVSLSGLFVNLTGAKSFMGITLLLDKEVPLFHLPGSTGFLHEFNIYGLTAGLGFWGACYFLVQKRKLSHIVAAGICLVAVFFAGSRAIYLAVAVGIVVLFKPFRTRWTTRLLFGTAVLGGVVLGLYIAFGTEWGGKLLGTDAGLTRLSAGRTVLWPSAVFAIFDQPLYGYGFAGSASKAAVLNHGASILYNEPVPAHNAFLDISLRGGALLAIFYVAAVWRSMRRLAKVTAAAATYGEKMRSRIVSIILVTVFLSAMFMPHSLGGIGYVSLVLTTFAGIANLWPELKVYSES
ncbi:O-antigen ligase [Salinibacter ruber]|uniref:O-antigen ligase family protein n=1 Tax=Salinibacter ruber TaxID=146919 RepID=UPI002168AD38|nr:O-antigen ligase family protein [Salinibacter ruber]MCS4193423.1 O-antigen ligase [Salinibacter ruber]